MTRELLNRAEALLLAGGDVEALLATVAVRMAVESRLRELVVPLLGRPLRCGSVALLATILCNRGLLTQAERRACTKLGKLAGRAIHRARVEPETALRCFDFGCSIVERLDRRLSCLSSGGKHA